MTEITPSRPIAYFCAEYGIQSNLPLYAGGLGVLAGDTIKEAADRDLPFIGVGLLYRGERIIQEIDADGMQIEKDMPFDPVAAGLEHVYKNDQPLFIRVRMTEIDVWARVWKKTFSKNVCLYLLDTDTDQNQQTERSITHGLYIGTEGTTLKQMMILGIGGVKLLKSLGVNPCVYHMNEGRAAFAHWQLIRQFMDEHGLAYHEAKEMAKKHIVYTNHTLVAAGNNSVDVSHLRAYGTYYAQKMGISFEQLIQDGIKEDENRFMMTDFSLAVSRKANGVSALHTRLSNERWPGYNWVNITNGVHMPTWQDNKIRNSDKSDDSLWHEHLQCKRELMEFVQARTGFGYDPNRMVISWARRLAGYKRLDALFTDVERLRTMMRRQGKEVQLLVSGKAHILDTQGKIYLQKVIKFMARELASYAIYIPNYDLDVAQQLVKGSDLWINVPEFGMEACGTSGMKAISNGVLKCTVPDGWADEVDWTGIGWTLKSDNVSNELYHKLENEIIPLYYERNERNMPIKWIKRMKKSIELSDKFSATRMLNEYLEKLYECDKFKPF